MDTASSVGMGVSQMMVHSREIPLSAGTNIEKSGSRAESGRCFFSPASVYSMQL
jgi:hypothetical protein